ncbi:uncharacterized protein PRCAT00001632001 [Priceomyces carsonii]|uniref:uncharacterized protein n=1 Tax=Priceomyces carsonii TaxID=28549 RepID=UPI002EDAA654|nr:unnamed protein product [Priceomyces carsonii]
MPTENLNVLFEGARNFRVRLILSVLSGRPIKITKIRSNDVNPGLKDYEVSFLRLLEAVTNGSHIEISYTGTAISFRPGIIIGGELTHNCPCSKPVGYFIEPMLYLAPFSKKKFSIVFKGTTASDQTKDSGVDSIKWGLLPLMEKFGVRDVSLHINKRGSPPLGGGEVHLLCNSLIQQPITIHAIDSPKFSAIRGIAYCTRVSPSVVNRMIDTARNILKPIGAEVNITADVLRGDNSGKSPGFGLMLAAELKTGWRILTDGVGSAGSLPEDLSERVTYELLEELRTSASVSQSQLLLCLVYMSIGKEDVGRIKLHKHQIDEKMIWILRDIESILGTHVYFNESEDEDNSKEHDYVIASIKGIGFTSASKKLV